MVQAEAIDVSHKAILYLEGVTVSFDGFRALNDLSISIDVGELRCVIGPNGAGKTTMMDVITGKTRPDTGTVFLGQTLDLTQLPEYEIARLGVGRKFQKPSVFENHSVYENLELAIKGPERRVGYPVSPARFGGRGSHRRNAHANKSENPHARSSGAFVAWAKTVA